jgi:transposase
LWITAAEAERFGDMVRSRKTKIATEEKARLVLAVLANEMTCAEAARRCGVTAATVTKWKHQFLEAGAERLREVPSGSPEALEFTAARCLDLRTLRLTARGTGYPHLAATAEVA